MTAVDEGRTVPHDEVFREFEQESVRNVSLEPRRGAIV
jgi:hypothetical protein